MSDTESEQSIEHVELKLMKDCARVTEDNRQEEEMMSVETLATAATAAASTENSSQLTSVDMEVNRFLWKYLTKSSKFSSKVEKLGIDLRVSIVDDGVVRDDKVKLSLTGDNQDDVIQARDKLEELAADCQRAVRIIPVSVAEQDSFETVVDGLGSLSDSSSAVTDAHLGVIYVIGTESEILFTAGMLQEVYGINVDVSGENEKENKLKLEEIADGGDTVEVLQPVSLKLWEADNVTATGYEDDVNLYGHHKAQTIQVNTNIWKYMQKATGNWAQQVTQVRDKMGVNITECISDDGVTVTLSFSGMEDDMEQAASRLKEMIELCSSEVTTCNVSCRDQKVFSKVSKFLPHINKSGAFVTVIGAEILATGTQTQLDECREKLEKLGASLERASKPMLDKPAAGDGQITWGAVIEAAGVNEEEALQLQRDSDERWKGSDPSGSQLSRTSRDQEPARGGSQLSRTSRDQEPAGGGSHFAELPVPIEDALWLFVEKRRESVLQELRDAYLVKISSYPGQEGFVIVCIEAQSEIMLECAQESLIQLLEQLRGSVVVNNLQTAEGSVESFPPEVSQLFDQLSSGTDAIIQVSGNNLSIIGPQQAAAECHQKLMTFMQQQQQTAGMGGMEGIGGTGMGRGRGMGRGGPGQMAGRGGMPPGMGQPGILTGAGAAVSDAERARQLRNEQLFSQPDAGPGRIGGVGGVVGVGGASGSQTDMANLFRPGGRPPGVMDTATGKTDKSTLRVRFADDEETDVPTTSSNSSAAAAGPSTAGFSRPTAPNTEKQCDNKTCSVCHSSNQGEHQQCKHAFCVSCVQQYFTAGQQSCPVCGSGDSVNKPVSTQPTDGVMLVTYDNGFKLPGHEAASRGTIVVTYCFPAGVQKAHQPHPGQKYVGVSKTAFFPLNVDGTSIVDRLQRAFDEGLVFAMVPAADGSTDEIGWNGIQHKTNIYGGPQLAGYPDSIYFQRVQRELSAAGVN